MQSRGWGVEIQPDVYNKQKELWDQVSRRTSLSALSLATTMHRYNNKLLCWLLGLHFIYIFYIVTVFFCQRPITKEEKDKENNKKSSPTKAFGKPIPGQVHFVDNKLADGLTNRLYNIRHHLERTTGPGECFFIFFSSENLSKAS